MNYVVLLCEKCKRCQWMCPVNKNIYSHNVIRISCGLKLKLMDLRIKLHCYEELSHAETKKVVFI